MRVNPVGSLAPWCRLESGLIPALGLWDVILYKRMSRKPPKCGPVTLEIATRYPVPANPSPEVKAYYQLVPCLRHSNNYAEAMYKLIKYCVAPIAHVIHVTVPKPTLG